MQIVGYLILVFGVVGIGLGLYGLVIPSARRSGFAINLPALRMPGRGGEDVDKLIAELEQSGFRASPFESLGKETEGEKQGPDVKEAPARFGRPALRVERVAKALNVEGVEPLPMTPSPAPDPAGIRKVSLQPEATPSVRAVQATATVETGTEEAEEEIDPVVAELLEEVQAEFQEDEAVEDEATGEPEEAIETKASGGDPLAGDMLSLFEETATESKTSPAIREATPDATVEELLTAAREVRELMANGRGRAA